MLTTHPTLPTDIVGMALEAACPTPDHTLWDEYTLIGRVAWFASTLRVSRSWYTAGQHALYHHICVFSEKERTNDLLIRTLSRKPHIAQMVKKLHIRSLYDPMKHYHVKCLIKLELHFTIPSVPFVTEMGRKAWRRQRQHGKLVQLLGLCAFTNELSFDQPNITLLIDALDSIGSSTERLVIQEAHRICCDQWERLVHTAFWRGLRAIRLDTTDPYFPQHGTFGLDIAFLGRERYTSLEGLEIVGNTSAKDIRMIIELVRPTLRTLACFQPKETSTTWISPASSKLETLVLTLQTFTRPIDLSLFTRLKHLTISLLPTALQKLGSAPFIPPNCLPPFIAIFELHVAEECDPWCAAAQVAHVLRAFDLGLLPDLNYIIVTVEMTKYRHLNQWKPAAFLLASVVRRRRLQFRLDVRFDMCALDPVGSDIFSRGSYEWAVASNEEWAEVRRGRFGVSLGHRIIGRLLTGIAGAFYYLNCTMYISLVVLPYLTFQALLCCFEKISQ